MKAPMIDYHVHESRSRDARSSTIPLYIDVAEATGVEEVCFTTHFILSGPDVKLGIRDFEIEGYFNEIRELDMSTDVSLKAGLEIDYIPGDQAKIERVVDEYSWDYILGSVHFVGDWDVGSRKRSLGFFSNRPLIEATGDYFGLYKEAIETGLFDMMAHPDYWRRYLHLVRDEAAAWEDYGHSCFDVIDALKSYDTGFEVNTSGRRHEHGVQYPISEFIEAAYEAGVSKVITGSDSHLPNQLGFWFEEAVEMLSKIGYKNITSFKGRKPIKNPIR